MLCRNTDNAVYTATPVTSYRQTDEYDPCQRRTGDIIGEAAKEPPCAFASKQRVHV